MLPIVPSKATQKNRGFKETKRKPKEDNLGWLTRARPPTKNALLLLLGGADVVALRIRVAQSHARHDMTPSHWSHVAFLDPTSKVSKATCHEVSLEPADGFGFPPKDNGVQEGSLSTYRDPKRYPNIAVAEIPVPYAELARAIARFRRERGAIDAVELIVSWLGFLWGAGAAGNPLLQGQGLPAAAFVESVAGAAGYELTPGLASRSSCPEAIWQAFRWWHEYYEKTKRAAPQGAWCTSHYLVPEL